MHQILSPYANLRALNLIFRTLAQHRELLWEMTRRDILDRQAGLAFGGFWVIGQPLLMMLVYVYVFSFVFAMRLGVGDNGFGYVAFLLAGLVPWLAIQEAVGRASTCIIENKSFVKQLVFPVEVLPLKLVLSTLLVLGGAGGVWLWGRLQPLRLRRASLSVRPAYQSAEVPRG